MTNNSGTLVIATVRPQSTLDNFPTVFSGEVRGGAHQVDNITDRDNIPLARRQEGMLCYVVSEEKYYILKGGIDNTDWEEFATGGGGGITYTGGNGINITGSTISVDRHNSSLLKFTNNQLDLRNSDIDHNQLTNYSVDQHRVINDSSVTTTSLWSSQKIATELNGYIPLVQKGTASGVAPLNSASKIDAQYLPSFVEDVLEFPSLGNFPNPGETGKIYVALDTNKTYRWSGSSYIEISPSEVNSVNGQTGAVTLTASDVGAYPDNNPSNFISSVNWNQISGAQSSVSLSGFNDDLTPYTNTDPTAIEVGGIETGTTFSNTPIHEIFDAMFYPELFGTITNISRTFTSNQTGLREVGATISTINLSQSFNRGSINPQYETATPFRSGNPNSYQYQYQSSTIHTDNTTSLSSSYTVVNHTVILGTQTWRGRVSYDAGPQPRGSKGTNFNSPLPAGITAYIDRTITGVYPFFATTSNLTTMTKQGLQTHGSVIITAVVAEDGTNKQSVEIPQVWGTLSKLEQFNTLSGDYDEININSFTLTSIQKNINGTDINYNKYTHNGDTIGARTLRWTF